jgi:hypothetical protein
MYQFFVEDYFSKITLQLGNVSVKKLIHCQGVKLFLKNSPPQKTDTFPSCKVIYEK